MSTVQEVEEAIGRLSAAEIQEVADWLENFLEDQKELTPEFAESIRRGEAEIESGRGQIVKP
ncbi:MAG TPA: hypothetical protein PLX89_22750 [Verrucomicrobiota bacterium]|nr:hypothetical protein [Verrucomicrobiota bacterium]